MLLTYTTHSLLFRYSYVLNSKGPLQGTRNEKGVPLCRGLALQCRGLCLPICPKAPAVSTYSTPFPLKSIHAPPRMHAFRKLLTHTFWHQHPKRSPDHTQRDPASKNIFFSLCIQFRWRVLSLSLGATTVFFKNFLNQQGYPKSHLCIFVLSQEYIVVYGWISSD